MRTGSGGNPASLSQLRKSTHEFVAVVVVVVIVVVVVKVCCCCCCLLLLLLLLSVFVIVIEDYNKQCRVVRDY